MATASLPLFSHPPLHTDDNVSSTQCAAVDAEREGKLTVTLAFKALPSVWFVSVPIKTRVPHCMDAHHACGTVFSVSRRTLGGDVLFYPASPHVSECVQYH